LGHYMVTITIDPLKTDEFLRDYITVVESVGRGEISRDLEMILTYLSFETNMKMWTVWISKNKEEIIKFYEKITYLKIETITPVGLISTSARSNRQGRQSTPYLSSEVLDTLDRLRDDFELILLELAKSKTLMPEQERT